MCALAIVLLCIFAAIIYGVIHNQFTARICIEYFTVAHPPIFPTESPTVLAIGWGILATWWVGLLLGVGLAMAARLGSRPPRTTASLLLPIGILLVAMAASAALAGWVGGLLAQQRMIDLTNFVGRIPRERNIAFTTVAFAHNMSYLSGFVGGIITMVSVWRSR